MNRRERSGFSGIGITMNAGSWRFGLCLLMWASTIPAISSASQREEREERAPGIEVAVSSNLEDDGRLVSYELAIVNRQSAPLDASWRLYFNLGSRVVAGSASSWVELTHVNGDFYRLSPGTTYEPIPVRERRTFRFQARGSVVNRSSGPRGFYWTRVDDGRESVPQRIDDVVWAPFERPEQTSRNPRDRVEVPTPESRYRVNASLSLLEAAEVPPIVPTPRTIGWGSGDYALEGDVGIGHASGLEAEAAYLSEALRALVGEAPVTALSADDAAHAIRLSLDRDADPERAEGYRLVVDLDRGIDVVGADRAGVFYGVQSLLALLRPDRTLPAVTIDDAPRFPYRGQHLDVARHFQPVGAVLRLIDVMARYKLNKLHLHLTDDEGWRIAIEALPGLTSIGSRRGHTLDGRERDRLLPSLGSGPDDTTTGSGFYTRQDYIDILEHATARHVEVIPEIDLPGHARAAIVAMRRGPYRLDDPDDASEYRSIQGWDDNVVDVCSELTYRFLETVLDDLVGMYAEAKAPFHFFHIGGDEVPAGVWERSPSCEALLESGRGPRGLGELVDHFLDRAHAIVEARGLRLGGWEEIALTRDSHDLDAPKVPSPRGAERGYRVNAWLSVPGRGNEATAYRLANAGYEVILSNASHLYFDMAYEKGADEPGMYWAGFVDTRRVWSFSPLSLETGGTTDVMGQPLPPDYASDWPKLTAPENIVGLQGQLWSETLSTPDLMERAALPKLLALAERAWSPEDRSDVAWNRFANALGQRELPRLDALGVAYRLPPPGAIVEDGRLRANVAFPGLAIRFTLDGTDPTASSERYVEPVPVGVGVPVRLRSFDTTGRGSRVVEVRR